MNLLITFDYNYFINVLNVCLSITLMTSFINDNYLLRQLSFHFLFIIDRECVGVVWSWVGLGVVWVGCVESVGQEWRERGRGGEPVLGS